MKFAERRFEPLRRVIQSVFTAARWGAWAQALAARHQRVAERRGSPALVLAERASVVWKISQRWEWRAWQISPQIHLSINAFLQRAQAKSGRSLFISVARGEPRQMILRDHAPVRSEAVAKVAIRPFRQVEAPEDRRLDRGETITTLLRPVWNLHTALELTRRVVEEKRRIELRPRGSSAPLNVSAGEAFNSTSLVFNQPAQNGQSSAQQAQAQAMNARNEVERQSSFVAPPPPINLDQITEQVVRRIDDRIVAHRERMGRSGY